MDKIINGKTYNTETAKMVVGWCSEIPRNDPSFFEECLYRKKTGEFFLHGCGNANSKYSINCGQNQWCGGEKIIPLTFESAREWAEKSLDPSGYNSIFGEIKEDENKKVAGFMVKIQLIEKLKRTASERGCTTSDIINELIEKM